ncbi:CHASE2 domain-containing protein [Magnetofaba australis]|uniref:Putative adenylate/guanylate cyclase n=1 Tax=Magnetofaba australis IT-1 TaxID=1434232 RepID=A0A1Y2K5U3_9PROT|nr:adenylate/guanylate cyclase domain-containing protein [Magnetofaba australis]OSM04353.1 putative adenylate/guanylate cyclase [Magnetofaba australis IT-1]
MQSNKGGGRRGKSGLWDQLVKYMHLWLSLAVMLGAIYVEAVDPAFRATLRNVSFDMFQRWKPREYQTDLPVRIVDVDEASLAQLGQWPWPRTLVAKLVDQLNERYGAASIVFDFVFAEKDRTSPDIIANTWNAPKALRDQLKTLPNHDEALAQAFGRAPVVAGFTMLDDTTTDTPRSRANIVFQGPPPTDHLRVYPGAVRNLEIFEKSATGVGVFSFSPDHDGVIRHVPVMTKIGKTLFPSLAIEGLRVALGAPYLMVQTMAGDADVAQTGSIEGLIFPNTTFAVPTDGNGEIWLHHTKPTKQRYVSAAKVLDGTADPTKLTGHIVFIGTSAKGLLDLRYGPFGIIPGVEVHAQIAEQVLSGAYLERPAWINGAVVIFLIVMWVVLVVLLRGLNAVASAMVGVVAAGAAWYGAWYAFSQGAVLVDPLFPTLAVLLMFAAYIGPKYLQSEREQKWIQDAFSAYVSPNLVKHLVEHPDLLQIGGEERVCSFVMTDLAGFTTLMEKNDAKEMVDLLNVYLDEMVKIAFAHDGTLDRIVGDAVAIIFSAPVEQEDHAKRAIACALEMDVFGRKFSAEQQALGVNFGKTRIGVNTGVVMVGNFGGETMFDYRALGDPINTAARLESVNKHLGTNMCVAHSTVELCGDDFVGRPVAGLVLKGKSEAIYAYEPMSAETLASERVQRYMAAYQLLKQGDEKGRASINELAELYPDDPVIQLHKKRLSAPEAPCSDVIVMSEK